MYKNWKQGIPCHVTRKERLCDLNNMVEIDNAITEKSERERQINKMKESIGRLG